MILKHNYTIKGKHQKPIVIDTTQVSDADHLPIIIFCHGYKGFKDWGAWHLMANAFAKAGFLFIKFNFSHNGGTVEQPIDFPDLEAFGNNNYTKELDDLACVIDWIFKNDAFKSTHLNNLTLMGHSRGGGIVCIKAEEDPRIKQVITLAGVSNYSSRSPMNEGLEQWKQAGVKYVLNGRTKQHMPHYYQFYEDFINNRARLTIKRAVSCLKIPFLIIHGNEDTSVLIEEAENLHQWQPKSELQIINGANHVFNIVHPWKDIHIPKELEQVVSMAVAFIKLKI